MLADNLGEKFNLANVAVLYCCLCGAISGSSDLTPRCRSGASTFFVSNVRRLPPLEDVSYAGNR